MVESEDIEEYEVLVTRKGQTTIPAKLRKKYGIKEGSRLIVIDSGNGILLKPAISIIDLAGSGSKRASIKEMKILLDKLRDEDL
ncbi:MAG: AbrB/MazE/SpoVT family DNA-binding domain-containing protein [Nitrososphaerota archaeon]